MVCKPRAQRLRAATAPCSSTTPAVAASIAPPPIMIAPPIPLAVPARCGRTDNMPAVEFGKTNPLPSPTQITNPKKVQALP